MKTGKNRVFLKKVEFFLFLISEFQITVEISCIYRQIIQ